MPPSLPPYRLVRLSACLPANYIPFPFPFQPLNKYSTMITTQRNSGLRFDFEDEADIMNEDNNAALSTEQRRQMQQQSSEDEFDRRQGTVVCKHWLRSLCKKADKCEFLHKYDIKKMRECEYRTTQECGIVRCPFRHSDVSDDVEKESCVPYDLGFCPDGPHCKSRHQRRQVWERPKIADWDAKPKMKIKRQEERAVTQAPNQQFKTAMCAKYNGGKGFCRFGAECHFAHSENELRKHPKTKHDAMAFLQGVDLVKTTELLKIPYSPFETEGNGGQQNTAEGGGSHSSSSPANGAPKPENKQDEQKPGSEGAESQPASSQAAVVKQEPTSDATAPVTVAAGGSSPEQENAEDLALDTKSMAAAAAAEEEKPLPTRYFYMRCPTFKLLAESADCGVMLADVENMEVVNEAYDSGAPIVLIFSVFRSDSYQAIAKLESPLGDEDAMAAWLEQSGQLETDTMAAMHVQWLHITDVRFANILHLRKRLQFDMRLTKVTQCRPVPPRMGHALVVYAYLQPVHDIIKIEDGQAQIVDNSKAALEKAGVTDPKAHLFSMFVTFAAWGFVFTIVGLSICILLLTQVFSRQWLRLHVVTPANCVGCCCCCRLLEDRPISGVEGIVVACDRFLFDEFMRHAVCAIPYKYRQAAAKLRSGSILFLIDASTDQVIGFYEVLGRAMPRILPYGLLNRARGAYTPKDLLGGDEIQIRFQPILLCPNTHQGLLAKAICEYVESPLRGDHCDDVVRAVGEQEVSTMVNLLSRKWTTSPTRNAARDLKGRLVVGPQFATEFQRRSKAELGENFEKLLEGCPTGRIQLCGIGSGYRDFRAPDGYVVCTLILPVLGLLASKGRAIQLDLIVLM